MESRGEGDGEGASIRRGRGRVMGSEGEGEGEGEGEEVKWAMLFTLPIPVTDEELPPTRDLAMSKQPPPLISFLCLPQRSLGEAAHCFVEIVCADSAGRLLLSAKPRPAPAATTSAALPPRQGVIIICDATNLKVMRLPLPVGATCDDNERGFP